MKLFLAAALALLTAAATHAANSMTPWVSLFRGIEHATGTNNGEVFQLSVNALRVDLHDPDVRLLVTPPAANYIPDQRETLLQTPREFMLEHRVQVAVNGGYFEPGGYQYPSGTPAQLLGAVISQGRTVSVQTSTNDSLSGLFVTTNNQATFYTVNWPPASTDGIYSAIPGLYPVLVEGVNISHAYNQTENIHRRQPRTALGLSQDNRYLFLITIDGRQAASDGAFDIETADFLLLFGAWNGMNLDGGGSTCMVRADDCGMPVDVNRNSFQDAVQRPGSQRPIGCSFGVYAPSLPRAIQSVDIQPGITTALLTWQTEFPATTQVQYGLTTNYGNSTTLDVRMLRTHVATLAGLLPGSNYFFRAESSDGVTTHTFACRLTTASAVSRALVFAMTNAWKYSTNNLDGVSWKSTAYDDSSWEGPSNACFHIESSAPTPFAPRTTLLPPGYVVPIFRTYYFRTPFLFSGSTAGATLTFSNYIDDGAVFYLNGAELIRYRLPAAPTTITYTNAATSSNACPGYSGDAAVTCPDLFSVSGANLVQGTNIVAVEVHNVPGGTQSQDILFGSALYLNRPSPTNPRLFITSENGQSTLYWNGEGFTLQQSSDLSSPAYWSDVPGPITQSPTIVSQNGTVFYRLRN